MVFNCRDVSKTLAHAQQKAAANPSRSTQVAGGNANSLHGVVSDSIRGNNTGISRSTQNSSKQTKVAANNLSDHVTGGRI